MAVPGAAIWLPLCLEGGHATRMEGGGVGRHFKGYYPSSLQQAYSRGFQCHAAELSYTNKFYVLFGVSSLMSDRVRREGSTTPPLRLT